MLVDVGNGNLICSQRVENVELYKKGDIRKIKERFKRNSMLIDVRGGRHVRSLIHLDSNHVVISPLEKGRLLEKLENE